MKINCIEVTALTAPSDICLDGAHYHVAEDGTVYSLKSRPSGGGLYRSKLSSAPRIRRVNRAYTTAREAAYRVGGFARLCEVVS